MFCQRREEHWKDYFVGFAIGFASSETTVFLSIENQIEWISSTLEDENRINWRLFSTDESVREAESDNGAAIKSWNYHGIISISTIVVVHLFKFKERI